jgi:Big-like domain-containing protein
MRLVDRRCQTAVATLIVNLTSLACGGSGTTTSPSGTTSTPSAFRLGVSAPLGLFAGDSGQASAGTVTTVATDVSSQATWQSSNTSVATVAAGGVVTAIAPGTTSLTATYQGISASDTLTVLQDSDLLALTILSCSAQLLVGQTADCAVTMTTTGPSAGLNVAAKATWLSTNPAVLSIAGGGHATAVSAGQATISATYHAKTASLAVSVTAAQQDALRIDSGAQSGQFKVGNLVSISLGGICSVVSADTGQVISRLLDQNGNEFGGTSSNTVRNGSTSFSISRAFTIPQNATRVCAVASLQVGSKTVAATGPFGGGLCADVSP